MTERRALAGVGGEFRRDVPDQGWRSLVRLRWGVTFAALAGVGVWELYHILVVHSPFREVALNLLWGVLFSLGLIQICFRIVFRLFQEAREELEASGRDVRLLEGLAAASQEPDHLAIVLELFPRSWNTTYAPGSAAP